MWNPFKKSEEDVEISKYRNEEDAGFDPSILETVEEGETVDEGYAADGGYAGGNAETAAETQKEPFANDSLVEDSLAQKLKKTVRGLLLALVVLMPVFFLPFTAPSDTLAINKQVLLYGIVLASFVLWVVIAVRGGGVKFKLGGLEVGVLALLAAGTLSAIFSSQSYRSFMSAGGFVVWAALAVFWILVINFFERRDVGKLVNCFLLGSSLAVLAGTLSLFGLPVFKFISLISYQDLTFGKSFNTVGSMNSLGALGLALFAVIAAQYFNFFSSSGDSETKKRSNSLFWRVVKMAGFLASALLLVILNRHTFYIVAASTMVSIILWPWLADKLFGFRAKFRSVSLMGPLVILLLSLLFLVISGYFRFDFPGQGNLPLEVSLSQRGTFNVVKETFADPARAALGFGQENFSIAFDKFKPAELNNTSFWNVRFANAASELTNVAVETGAAGLAAFVFVLYLVFRSLFRRRTLGGESLAGLSVAASGFFAVLLLFVFDQFNIVLLFVFWFLLALLALETGSEENQISVRMDDASASSIFASLGFVLVLVFGLIGGYLNFTKYRAEAYFAEAARVSIGDRASAEKAINLLTKAANGNTSEDRYLNALAQVLLTRIDADLKNKTDKPEEVSARIENYTRAVTQIASRLASNHKNDAVNWSNSGFIYENLINFVTGADQAALTAYDEYLKRAPRDPAMYVRIGGIYLNQADRAGILLANTKKTKPVENEKEILDSIAADYSSAEENFKKAIAIKGDLATAIYNLGVVYERQTKLKDAIKQLKLARLLDPPNPGLAFELGLLYYRNSEKDSALNEMAQAVNLFRDYSNARWYLALMLEEKGQIDLAIQQLEEILKLEVNKGNQIVKDKLAALQSGKREFPPGRVVSKKPLEETSQ